MVYGYYLLILSMGNTYAARTTSMFVSQFKLKIGIIKTCVAWAIQDLVCVIVAFLSASSNTFTPEKDKHKEKIPGECVINSF